MQGFLSDCQKHEKSKSHMEAYKMLITFDVSERVDLIFSRARREEIERFNEEVRQNRVTLKILSEAVLYLSKQELSFRGHDESSVSLNKGNYRELLELIAKFDPQFERRLHGRLENLQRGPEGVGTFTGVSSDIQNDSIESIDVVIQDEIDKEDMFLFYWKGDMVFFLNFLCLNSNFCLSIEILNSKKQLLKSCWITSTISTFKHIFLRFLNFCY